MRVGRILKRSDSRHDESIMSPKNRSRQNSRQKDLTPVHPEAANPRPHALPAADARGQHALNRVLFSGFLLLTFVSLCFPLYDTDFWWHLKTGEWILTEGGIPQVDLYTFTEVGKPWIDLHWGFQLFITLLYRLGGVNLVILAKAAVITAAVAVAWSAGGRSLPVWVKTALWILPIICISGRTWMPLSGRSSAMDFLRSWMLFHCSIASGEPSCKTARRA